MRLLNVILTVIVFYGCNMSNARTKPKSIDRADEIVKVDTSKIVIFSIDELTNKMNYLFDQTVETELTSEDLKKIDQILVKKIELYNEAQKVRFSFEKENHSQESFRKSQFYINLANYKRQYIATTNSKGEKEVWVNCFCNTGSLYWKKEIIFVFDGGNCFFNIKINISTEQCREFVVNGEG